MGTGDVVLVVLVLARQINPEMTLDLFLPTSGDRPFYGAIVERRHGPSWLRDDDDDDDDDDDLQFGHLVLVKCYYMRLSLGVFNARCTITQSERSCYRMSSICLSVCP